MRARRSRLRMESYRIWRFHLRKRDELPNLGSLIGPYTELLRVSKIAIIPEAPQAGTATRSGVLGMGAVPWDLPRLDGAEPARRPRRGRSDGRTQDMMVGIWGPPSPPHFTRPAPRRGASSPFRRLTKAHEELTTYFHPSAVNRPSTASASASDAMIKRTALRERLRARPRA